MQTIKCTVSLKPIHRCVIKCMYSIGFSQLKILRGVIYINSCFCLIIIDSNVAHKPQRCNHSVSLYASPETEWNIPTGKQFMLTQTYTQQFHVIMIITSVVFFFFLEEHKDI